MTVNMWSSLTTAEAAAHITRIDTGEALTWTGQLGAPVTLSYGFLDTSLRFDQGQIDTTKEALALWADLANIHFTYLNGGSPDVDPYIGGGWAQINFANFYDPDNGGGASTSQSPTQGAVYVGFNLANNKSGLQGQELGQGEKHRTSLLHEIGHALGLEHPGDYNADVPGETFDYQSDRGYIEDSQQYSVMSYFKAYETYAQWDGQNARTPMLHDVSAIQMLYGANLETRTGMTIYGFNSNAGPAFEISSSLEEAAFTVWDAGGFDTLDFSGYYVNQVIRLTNGSYSDVGGLTSNIAIAELWTDPTTGVQYGWIENAKGGYDKDYIFGNEIGNTISGNDGDDSIWGYGGEDILIGGGDDDNLYGGAGYDILIGGADDDVLDGSLDGIADVLDGGTGNDTYAVYEYETVIEDEDAGFDTIVTDLPLIVLPENVETLRFAGDAETPLYVIGSESRNFLYGGIGDDVFWGNGGNDILDGGGGADELHGGRGDDTYYIDTLLDRVIEEPNAQIIYADGIPWMTIPWGGTDVVHIDTNAMVLGGGFTIYALPDYVENAVLDGGSAFNLIGNSLGNEIHGNNAPNLIFGFDGVDYIYGNGGADTLFGGAGADTLDGGAGDDILFADEGNDTVYGGEDNDVIHVISGNVTVHGDDGIDTLSFEGSSYDLQIALATRGANYFIGGSYADGSGGWTELQTVRWDGIENLTTGDGDDVLAGDVGNNVLDGGAGDDTFLVDVGYDTVIGGWGNDTLSFIGSTYDLKVNLANYWAEYIGGRVSPDGTSGWVQKYAVFWSDIENLTTGAGDDELTGDGGDNRLDGSTGDDTVYYSGSRSEYTISGTRNDFTITDSIAGRDGTDTLLNIEFLKFADGPFRVADLINVAPEVTAEDRGVQQFASLSASSLFSASDGDGDAIIRYRFYDATPDSTSGHFTIDGVVHSSGEIIEVTAAQLALTSFQVGTTADDLLVQAFDGTDWSDWTEFHLTPPAGLTLIGTAGSDTLTGSVGNDHLEGRDGMDFLKGGDGADELLGGGGTDFLYVDADDILIDGGDGFDYVYLDSSKAYGADFKVAGTNVEYVGGTFADDRIDASGVTYHTVLNGNYGNDVLIGGTASDSLNGSADDDTLTGGPGSDIFYFAGRWGNDAVTDFVHGEDVLDMTGVSGLSSISQFSITETAQGASIAFGAESILLHGVRAGSLNASDFHFTPAQIAETAGPGEILIGTAGTDTLTGGAGNDHIEGRDGMDFLKGGEGADELLGGAGTDFLYVDADDTLIDGGDGFDYVVLDTSKPYGASFSVAGTNVEYVTGTLASDRIDASGVNYHVVLNGNYGNDVLIGGAANDSLNGSAGDDILTGGAGNDTFYFAGHWGNDTIRDFVDGEDVLDMAGVSGLTNMSQLLIADTSDGASIAFGADSILLQGVNAGSLTASDFHLLA